MPGVSSTNKALVVSGRISSLKGINQRTTCLTNLTWLLIACSFTGKRKRKKKVVVTRETVKKY